MSDKYHIGDIIFRENDRSWWLVVRQNPLNLVSINTTPYTPIHHNCRCVLSEIKDSKKPIPAQNKKYCGDCKHFRYLPFQCKYQKGTKDPNSICNIDKWIHHKK